MWKALRMCSTKAKSESGGAGAELVQLVKNVVVAVAGSGLAAVVYDNLWGPATEYSLNQALQKIVTAPYNPEMPKGMEYIKREQHDELKDDLHEHIHNGNGFFVLMGESGSGKTTMMQNLLTNEYKEGVLFVTIDSGVLQKAHEDGGVAVRDMIEASVLKKFTAPCYKHPKASDDVADFIKHANQVRMKAKEAEKAKGKDVHPLIIYITLDSKKRKLSYEAMVAIAESVGGMASNLSTQHKCCKTILEFSKTGISDTLREVRTHEFDRFEVAAMTETEFQAIGKQLIPVKDPENLVEPYLQYCHDWMGGHTKTLMALVHEEAVKKQIESATPGTREEVLTKLKAGIDTKFKASVKQLRREQPEAIKLLTAIAATGLEGLYTDDLDESDIMSELMNRDSSATLLRKVDAENVRIHRYSHALYLLGVEEPKPNDDRVNDVKKKFGMNAKSA